MSGEQILRWLALTLSVLNFLFVLLVWQRGLAHTIALLRLERRLRDIDQRTERLVKWCESFDDRE